MTRLAQAGVVLSVVLILSGCAASGTPIKEAPLSADRQQELRRKLIGEWEQTYRKSSKDDPRQPLRVTIKEWTFYEDGTGQLVAGSRNTVTGRVTNSNTFSWSLQGRNLAIGEDGSENVKFRIEKWSDDEMTWFDYPSSTYYIVEKQ